MGIWDEPAGAFPAALAQDGVLARALASLYDNRIIPIPRGTAEEAGAALYGMTGIPDIQAGAQAMGRGEYLPGLGQMTFGVLGAGALGAPVARGAMTAGREALGAVPGVLADTRGAIRAFHGSPYDFERFDMSKIGTGEGAQAYGHGLYLAESEDVARVYRDQVKDMAAIAAANARMSELARQMDPLRKPGTLREFTDPRGNELVAEYDRLMAEKMKPGRMYEARINAEPEQFLDWDKPLVQQSEAVRSALENAGGAASYIGNSGMPLGHFIRQAGRNRYTASDLFNRGGEPLTMTDADVSARLWEAGIPGSRYLDQSSRTPMGPATYTGELTAQQRAGLDALNASGQSRRWEVDAYTLLKQLIENYQQSADALARGNKAVLPNVGEKLAGMRALDPEKLVGPTQTSNYVVFDDKLIDIIRKYGLAGLAAPGALAPAYTGER
jgi:hypothetical protein